MASRFEFSSQREQSAVKTEIVTKYFSAWSKIMKRFDKIAYIDLYSGPGIYDDGAESTPIIILTQILSDPVLSKKVVTVFNEKDNDYYDQLKNNIGQIRNINDLTYKPNISNKEIDRNTAQAFNKRLIPCFSFIDPAGYRGLSLDLIKALGKDHGSDLILFFNYNDINRGINNHKVEEHMEYLFGRDNYKRLVRNLYDVNERDSECRELMILNEMAEAIRSIGLKYVLPFKFKFEGKNRTSHYLIFASKNFLGYNIMKEIMYKSSEKDLDGVGKYEFIPSSDKCSIQLSLLDMFNSSLEELKNRLVVDYRGRTVSVSKLYETDSVNNRYIKKHYKDVLKQLEKEKKIYCKPAIRKANTMADTVVVTFL